MPSQFAPVLAPSALSWIGIARENYTGDPVMPVTAVPIDPDAYEPEDTPVFLRDQGVRATMGGLFGTVPGPLDATFAFGFPLYLDSAGYWLDNVLGDLSSTSSGAFGTAIILENPLTVGAVSLNTGHSVGAVTTGSVILISDGAASEIVVASAPSSGSSVTFTGTPCRFAHATSATASLQTAAAGYTHSFAVLNSGTGQPATHTLTDWTGLTPTVGARAYPSAVVAEMDLTGDSAGLLAAKVAGSSWLSAPAAAMPSTAGSTYTAPPPSWASTITLGGQQIFGVETWKVSFRRQLVIYWGAGNAQTPYIIARGPLTVTGGLDYEAAVDEAPLTNMLSAGPLPLVISVSNGLPGAAALAMTITCSQTQSVKAKPVRGSPLIGYTTEWAAIDNIFDVGGSGGLGPAAVRLVNAVAAY